MKPMESCSLCHKIGYNQEECKFSRQNLQQNKGLLG